MSEPVYEHFEKEFGTLAIGIEKPEEIAGGCRWAEGPCWFEDGGYLIWSDIPNNRMLRWIPGAGVSVFRSPSNYVNGNTRDHEGRLISCSHGGRNVVRTEADGTLTVLADQYDGKRLNSPNDVVVKSDGTIWFTDPPYGILSDYEGYASEQEQAGCFVYCLDPATGKLKVVADDFDKPNGLAFSPDEAILYVSDTGGSHGVDRPHHIRSFDVGAGNTLSNPQVFAQVSPGLPDGFRLDTDGNIWTSAWDGVHCINSAGALLGKIFIPEKVSNVTFGGPRRNRLFITATSRVFVLYVGISGVQRP
jgi:gluconolactonase